MGCAHVSGLARGGDKIELIKSDRKILGNDNLIFRIGLFAFLWALLVAVLVQLILLPYVFPQWHAGDGLLKGGDWVNFHKVAVELAAQIKLQGWQVWELRPQGQAPSGIAAALYAFTGIDKPWVLLPLNAFLHALAAVLLFNLVQRFVSNSTAAAVGVLPFIMFPSAMTWYAMIHKDSLFIAGILMFLWGWIEIGWQRQEKGLERRYITAVFVLIFGMLFVWVVRPYFLSIMQMLVIFFCFAIIFKAGLAFLRNRDLPKSIQIIAVFLALATSLLIIPSLPFASNPSSASTLSSAYIPAPISEWNNSPWIPDLLENKISQLAATRDDFRFRYPDAGSNIDVNITFTSFFDIAAYFPRAMGTVLLQPFPSLTVSEAKTGQNTMMRRIAGFEMLVIYVSLLGLILFLWRYGLKNGLFPLIVSCLFAMLVQALTITNIGTLYRMRYVFLLTLVAIGLAAIIDELMKRNIIKSNFFLFRK